MRHHLQPAAMFVSASTGSPSAGEDPPRSQLEEQGGDEGSTDAITLLVVEDDPLDAGLVELGLRSSSFRFNVRKAVTLAEALDRLDRGGIDAILLDLGLPDSSGVQTLDVLRERHPEVPVIVHASIDDERLGQDAVAHGAESVLVKNAIHPRYLGRTVWRVVEQHATRRRLDEARRENRRLHELDELKDTFVMLTSHELRTPLTSIIGYVETLAEGAAGELTPLQQRFLGFIGQNGKLLLRFADDLLFLLRARDGHMGLELNEVDVLAVASSCVERARPAADEKHIRVELEAEAGPAIVGDEGRLTQLVDNLLANALRYSGEGGNVSVRVRELAGGALVEVEDTGPGIAPDDLEHVFEPFFRARDVSRSATPGAGLGLSIVKAIVDAHGGTVDVTSREGLGTTVSVAFPASAGTTEPAAPETAQTSMQPRVALVADDNPAIVELVGFHLGLEGFEVVTATNGTDALRLALERRPELAVLDVVMPGLTGYEIASRIREHDDLKGIAVVLLTAKVQDADVARGFGVGADDYLKKPFSPAELRSRVRALLQRSAAR